MGSKGISIFEILLGIGVLSLLTYIGILGYEKLQVNSRQKSAMAHLASYIRSSNLALQEFKFYPGNFEVLGFMPKGDLYYRIKAKDNKSQRIPHKKLNNRFCFSTEKCGGICTGNDLVQKLGARTKGCCCQAVFADAWQEVFPTYNEHKQSIVEDHFFQVYAFGEKEDNYLCADQNDVYIKDCSKGN